MKRFLLPILFLAIISCEQKQSDHDSEIAYKFISRTYVNNNLFDSLTYYYDNESKLVRRDECDNSENCTEFYLTYTSDSIIRWDGTYHINDNNEIYMRTEPGYATSFYEYTSGKITYEKLVFNDTIIQEKFYVYDGVNIVHDSIVSYQSDGIIVNQDYDYFYTDTISSDLYALYSEFFSFPLESKYLLKEARWINNWLTHKFSYEISDNELIIYCESYDLFNDVTIITVKTQIIRVENN